MLNDEEWGAEAGDEYWDEEGADASILGPRYGEFMREWDEASKPRIPHEPLTDCGTLDANLVETLLKAGIEKRALDVLTTIIEVTGEFIGPVNVEDEAEDDGLIELPIDCAFSIAVQGSILRVICTLKPVQVPGHDLYDGASFGLHELCRLLQTRLDSPLEPHAIVEFLGNFHVEIDLDEQVLGLCTNPVRLVIEEGKKCPDTA